MTGPFHTYGSTCLLADEDPELSSFYSYDSPPEVRSQFFYISSLPIDDPLAPVPLATGQGSENERAPPKPFSAKDNLALETSWQSLGKSRRDERATLSKSRPDTSPTQTGIAVPGQTSSSEAGRYSRTAHKRDSAGLVSGRSTVSNSPSFPDETPGRHLKSRSGLPVSSEPRKHVTSFVETSLNDEPPRSDPHDRKRELSSSLQGSPSAKRRSDSTLGDIDGADDGQVDSGSVRANRSRDVSISGSPFIRAPIPQSHSQFGSSIESLPSKNGAQESSTEARGSAPNPGAPKPSGLRATVSLDQLTQDGSEDGRNQRDSKDRNDEVKAKIPVGASRLHLVELPNLKVCPSIWYLILLS